MSGLRIGVLLAGLFGLVACSFGRDGARSDLMPDLMHKDMQSLNAAQRGAEYFYGDAFGGLSLDAMKTHAIPWKITAAALMLEARRENPSLEINQENLLLLLQQYGLVKPQKIANFPQGITPIKSQLPVGMVYGRLKVLPSNAVLTVNMGCSSCHGAVLYDDKGNPDTTQIWLGAPNTSMNVGGYSQAIYNAYVNFSGQKDELFAAIKTLYPETSNDELQTLRQFVMPQVKQRVAELKKSGSGLPFPGGGIGTPNGLGAIKMMMKIPLTDGGKGEVGITAIPELADRGWRSSLLVDGAYSPNAPNDKQRQRNMTQGDISQSHLDALAAITTVFSVGAMGVKPEIAVHNAAKARDIYAFLRDYRPPKFPGKIDHNLAAQGRGVFAAHCSSCHGTYDENVDNPRLLAYPNWLGVVGTDETRAMLVAQSQADIMNHGAYKNILNARATGKYVAPLLSGIWQSAPYLHNDSVPSLSALLNPSTRPEKFMVGGHALDFAKMGIRLDANGQYPAGYKPWSKPEIYDTNAEGHSNSGHEFGRALSPQEKSALLEYLKNL